MTKLPSYVKQPESLEKEKTELEIKQLRNETGVLGTFSAIIWPVIATVITLAISLYALLLSVHTQQAQLELQRTQHEQEKNNNLKQNLAKAIELATDPQGKPDRRIAGIWQLNDFLATKDDEVLVANVLAAELTLGDDYRLARCAAAEVIADAYGADGVKGGSQEQRAARMAGILYGNRSGDIGLVVRQHLLLRATEFGPTDRFGYSTSPDPKASNSCVTALDATREAIRKNWGYLREVNLNGTDLSRTQLYEADMANASFQHAYLRDANFRCADLSGADFTDANWDGADFHFANVTGAVPPTFVEYAKNNGAFVKMTDDQWLKWRKKGFLVFDHSFVLDSTSGSRCGEADLPPAPLR
jgi:hypothetical protein